MLTGLGSQAAVLQVMIDTVPVGIIIAEAPSGRVVHGNARMAEIVGRPLVMTETMEQWAAWVGYTIDGQRVPVEDHPLARAVAGQVTNGKICQVGRIDGSLAWVRIDGAPIHDRDGALIGGIVSVACIDGDRASIERLEQSVHQRTAALARSTGRNQALFDHSPFDIMVLQISDTGAVLIEEANPAFCRTTGLGAGAMRMQPLQTVLDPQTAQIIAADCRLALLNGGFECQYTLTFPVGERLVRAFYRKLPDDGDQDGQSAMHRVLLTQTDLTEVRRTETALRQAMRLEVIGQLTGGVAHEFNNLLTAILGNLELLDRRTEDERQRRWIAKAAEAAQRGALLTQQLLSYARKQFLAPVVTDIPGAIGGMTELIRGSLGGSVGLLTEFDPATWPALVDPAQLELAVINLVANARDAMRGGGTLTLSTRNVPADAPDLPAELAPHAAYVRLAVADTGTGMDPDVAARAMEPFFTTKGIGEGSGLGLSQAYGYARQLGGTLRLQSRPGQGTLVEVFLPRAAS